ncbi:MAG: phage holin family protein [Rhizobiales bacterium]|nr:phage holin family protein [Hyphomicrobiales bacterium]
MNSDAIVRSLRALWRSDRIIADIRLHQMLTGLGLRAFAALIAVFGLLMLELSAYFALVQVWNAILAAAVLGGINFTIAAIFLVIAARSPASRELDLATEVHGSAVEALQLEVRSMQSHLAGAIHHPLNSTLPALIVPLIMLVIRSLKSKAADKPMPPAKG